MDFRVRLFSVMGPLFIGVFILTIYGVAFWRNAATITGIGLIVCAIAEAVMSIALVRRQSRNPAGEAWRIVQDPALIALSGCFLIGGAWLASYAIAAL